MDARQLATDYIKQARVMQIATVRDGAPWICTVYFVADADFNLYWMSLPTRRHSQEIAADPRVAVAIAIKLDQPIIGLQFEGTVSIVQDSDEVKAISDIYVQKYNQGADFYDSFVAGTNQHQLYKFTPAAGNLFDEVTFADGAGHAVIPLKTL